MDLLTLFKPRGIYSIDRLYTLYHDLDEAEELNKAELTVQLDELVRAGRLIRVIDVEFHDRRIHTFADDEPIPEDIIDEFSGVEYPVSMCCLVPKYRLRPSDPA